MLYCDLYPLKSQRKICKNMLLVVILYSRVAFHSDRQYAVWETPCLSAILYTDWPIIVSYSHASCDFDDISDSEWCIKKWEPFLLLNCSRQGVYASSQLLVTTKQL